MRNKRHFLYCVFFWTLCLASWGRGAHVVTNRPNYQFSLDTPFAELKGQESEGTLRADASFEEGFCLSFTAAFQPDFSDGEILAIDDVLSVSLRWQKPGDNDGQNYAAFPLADGRVPVVEATLQMSQVDDAGASGTFRIGAPLAMLKKPWGRHQIVLNYTGVAFTLYVDGMLADNDFVLGFPPAERFTRWRRDARSVSYAALGNSAGTAHIKPGKEIKSELQYFMPEGHNAWMGDVATCWFGGRYHIFYLYDRRGHRSKLGRGGHYFEHLSTADFKTWTAHEAAVPLEYKWQTLGTGTPFVYGDSLYLSYGLHSTRITAKARQTLAAQWKRYEQDGHTSAVLMDTLQTPPAGSTYAVCTDGVSRFRKSNVLFHPCENPSISTLPDGTLVMFASYGARGTWKADRPEGPWRCVDENFPLGGDCTFSFPWGEYEYVIGGFTQMWRKSAQGTDDLIALGQDIYDGLSVPCVTEVMDGRRLMAGWVQVAGHWGGALVVRELMQRADGRLESRWMPELMPQTARMRQLEKSLGGAKEFATDGASFLLTFDVVAKSPSAKIDLQLRPRQGAKSATWWSMDMEEGRAQFADNPANREKTVREGAKPHQAGNYAIEGIACDEPRCPVRIIVKQTDKLGGSLVDVEIGGRRTMISYRGGLETSILRLVPQNAMLENVCLAPLKSAEN